MSKTEEFLKEAFAGESQANRKYQSFAAKADKEGFPRQPSCFVQLLRQKRSMPKTIYGL